MNQRHTFQNGDERSEYYLVLLNANIVGGVLVLHAWWGLTPVSTSICDQLAEAGLVAFAPDLYHGRTATTREEAEALRDTMQDDASFALIDRAIDELQARPEIRGQPIGVVGYSLGAFFALSLDRGVSAIVTYYGTTDPKLVTTHAPILGHFAENDEFEPLEDVRRFEQVLKAKGLNVNFYVYPNTRHWFAEHNQPGYYDTSATDQAWHRTTRFLWEYLAPARVQK
ncbi:MAG TPA: dienelactone hydrolase family protein [Anaerolineae bacterium]|nr:dienelactone hydrolase family protein [Anaerolineae bacterium]